MKNIIIIRGPLGSGKSTISRRLAAKLEAKYYSVDNILAVNKWDIVPEGEPCIPVENFLKVNNLLVDFLGNDSTENVVIDGNFYHKEQLEDLQEKLSENKIVVFTLKVDLEKCIERDANRENSHGKWAALAVHNLVSKFDVGIVLENNEDGVEEILERIESLYKKELSENNEFELR